MDARLVKSGIDFTRRRKRWFLAAAALAFSGYGAYRVYDSPPVARKMRRFSKLVGALVSLAEAASESAGTIGLVSKDLNEFLRSDSDEVPNSLKQISKIAKSTESSESIIDVSRALTAGALRGYRSDSEDNVHGNGGYPGFADRVLDKLFTPEGSGFASVVVGSLARSLVMAIHTNKPSNHSTVEGSTVPRWPNVLCDEKVKDLVGDCVQLFASTAVTVYLEKTMEINTYDDLFSGLTNPKHEKKAREMLVSVCNGTVETLVKTSHRVLKSSRTNTDSGPGVSSTLAVPSNRRLVLDVTGKVTFETVRSLLEYSMEKLCDGTRQSVNAVHEEALERGVEVARYVKAKSPTITAICLSLCLHILDGASILAPF